MSDRGRKRPKQQYCINHLIILSAFYHPRSLNPMEVHRETKVKQWWPLTTSRGWAGAAPHTLVERRVHPTSWSSPPPHTHTLHIPTLLPPSINLTRQAARAVHGNSSSNRGGLWIEEGILWADFISPFLSSMTFNEMFGILLVSKMTEVPRLFQLRANIVSVSCDGCDGCDGAGGGC